MGKTTRNTIEEVREFIESQGYRLLSNEYINNKTPLEVMCDKGHIYKTRFDSFKKGSRCSTCKHNKKLTFEEVKQYIESQGYTLLSSEYVNNETKLDVKCPDGHIYKVRYSHFKNGSRCPYCCGLKKKTYEEVKQYIESTGYKLISSEYVNNNNPLIVKCPKGHKYQTSYGKFKTGCRCPECMGCKKKTIDDIRRNIESVGYKLISHKYNNNKTPLEVVCNKGHIYKTNWNYFQQNQRCPICNLSKGEEKVRNILEDYKIDYEPQYRFDNCRNKLPLPFDFYIPEFNICIEYDGIQHFKPVDYSSKKSKEEVLEKFELNQLRDQIKDQYCKDNNIKLIRIPYTEFDNIEEILIKELNLKKFV